MNDVATQNENNLATRNADGSVDVTASNGKRIKIKRPHVLAQYRLVEALGDAADSRVYLRMCIPLLWVAAIDGIDVPTPTSKREVEGLIARLDEAGIAAVSNAIDAQFAEKDSAAAAKK